MKSTVIQTMKSTQKFNSAETLSNLWFHSINIKVVGQNIWWLDFHSNWIQSIKCKSGNLQLKFVNIGPYCDDGLWPLNRISYTHHITCSLYNLNPLFEGQKHFFKEVFSENSAFIYGWYSRVVCNQEQVMIVQVQ